MDVWARVCRVVRVKWWWYLRGGRSYVGPRPEQAARTPTGLELSLYRNDYGTIPLHPETFLDDGSGAAAFVALLTTS